MSRQLVKAGLNDSRLYVSSLNTGRRMASAGIAALQKGVDKQRCTAFGRLRNQERQRRSPPAPRSLTPAVSGEVLQGGVEAAQSGNGSALVQLRLREYENAA